MTNDSLREELAEAAYQWAAHTPVATAREFVALAESLMSRVQPYELTGHAEAEQVPADGAVFDADGALLQRSADATGWFQPGYDHTIDTEDITLPAVVIHPWGWRP